MRCRPDRSGAALGQQGVEFEARGTAQGGGSGARELRSIERCSQPHDPQAGCKGLCVGVQALGGAANLTLDQIARHGAAGVAFGNDGAEPDPWPWVWRWVDFSLVIHRLLTNRFSVCG